MFKFIAYTLLVTSMGLLNVLLGNLPLDIGKVFIILGTIICLLVSFMFLHIDHVRSEWKSGKYKMKSK